MAREKKPSVIFIDEVEALCGARDAEGPGPDHQKGVKTEFLVQMDGVGRDSSGVLVLAATNLPWKLDPAIRRRFQKRIHIGLPDQEARSKLFENSIGDLITGSALTAQDFNRLGQMTEGFSGSDISGIMQDVLMMPVKKIRSATHYKKVWLRICQSSLVTS
jgi:vacuolar protein-sorting-associated protein 4